MGSDLQIDILGLLTAKANGLLALVALVLIVFGYFVFRLISDRQRYK